MAIYHRDDLIQGSPEWHDFRATHVTATYAWRLLLGEPIADILASKQEEALYQGSKYTERGHLLEGEARQLYADLNNVLVCETGIIFNDKYPQYACSPDGLIGEDGGLEIKCFQEARHEDVFENLDSKIIAQIQFSLFVSERKWWDWVLYNPEVEDIEKAYHCKRFYPDEEIFEKFREALTSTEENPLINETATEIIKLQSQLSKQSDEIKQAIQFYLDTTAQIKTLKEQLKSATTGKVKKVITLGEDTLNLSIYDIDRIAVDDPKLVPDDFTKEVEVEGAYERAGKIYQKVPLTELAKNVHKAGKTLPPGFKITPSRAIRINFNGQSL